MDLSRNKILIGQDGQTLIASKSVCVVGVGGVGGMAVIALARCGIENFTLIDFDKVSSSNINRQIVAWQNTIGQNKVDVLKNMILSINPNAKVKTFNERICKENLSILNGHDIVVDAIDSIQDKVEMICYCKENNINIISAMGAGNRIDLPRFETMDIFKTHDDGLAKVLRKKLRERGVSSLQVVCALSKPIASGKIVGSIVYYPATCGLFICSVIINKILRREI